MMIFRDEYGEVNGEIVHWYYINGKLVDEKTYFTLSDELYANAKPPQEKLLENSYDDDTYSYFLDLVNEIRESDDDTAVKLLQEEFDSIQEVALKVGQYMTFNELGNYFMKQATRIEDELEGYGEC